MTLSRAFLTIVVAVLLAQAAGAAEPGYLKPRGVVFGSYLNLEYAQKRQVELGRELGLETRIVKMMVNGAVRYRVVFIAGDDTAARQVQAQAQAMGVSDAWVTTLEQSRAVVQQSAPPRQPAGEPPATMNLAAPLAQDAPDSQSPRAGSGANDLQNDVVEGLTPPKMGRVELSTDGTDVNITLPRFREGDFELELDGRLDEAFWSTIPGYDNLLVTDPDTMARPRHATDMRVFYTDKGMYIGVFMEQPPETLLARLSSRDEFLNRDSWGITLDTSGEGLYGYWFTINLGGSIMDGKVIAERQYSNEWDGPWDRASAELDNGWSAEMFLPWSMMTMPDTGQDRTFGFYVNRKVAYLDERWTWPALPFTSPAFMSVLAKMEAPGVAPKQALEIFPNVAYTMDEISGEDEYRAGVDLNWRPTTNLQVTATLNPDFGVVESDDVVINLSAFETFFPEKRLFFLEGQEVFQTTPRARVRGRGPSGTGARQTTSTFNPEPTTLLNTRRIGGPPRVDIPNDVDVEGVERGKPTDLLGAFKVTGQNGPFRYGVLSAFEDDVKLPGVINSGPNAGLPTRVESDGRDFGVVRFLYENTGAGRQSIGYLGTMVDYPTHEAIVHGVDGHWLSPNGLWQVDTQLMHSDVDDVTGNGVLADISYKPKQGHEHKLTLDYLEDTLNVRDLGFIRRNDSQNIIYRYDFSTGRGLEKLRSKRRSVVVSNEWNTDGKQVRGGYFFRNGWTFKNFSEIRTEFDYFPSRWDDRNSFGNGIFKVDDRFIAEVGFGTSTSKPLSFSFLAGMRQEELSDWTARYAVGMTYKPNDRLSFEFDVNYFDREGWLLHQTTFGGSDPLQARNMSTFEAEEVQPRIAMDVFLSARQQLRLTLQWAGIRAKEMDRYIIPLDEGDLIQVDRGTSPLNDFTVSRLTGQLRYRWEIGPLSDLFVVYTRGSNLPTQVEDGFSDLFSNAFDEPIVDLLVVKLRYRFGI